MEETGHVLGVTSTATEPRQVSEVTYDAEVGGETRDLPADGA
jgi:hypothetical protein